jgi:hypothetical protein
MKTAKPAAKSKSRSRSTTKSAKTSGKKKQPALTDLPNLEPDHPNFDTILLRRARLESYRERRRKNRPDLTAK